MAIPLQPSFLDSFCYFPHFRWPSYSFISYLVQLRNYNSTCLGRPPSWAATFSMSRLISTFPSVPLMSGHLQCTDTFAWSRGCPFMTGTTVPTSVVAFSFLRPPISFHVPPSTPMSLPRTPLLVSPLLCTLFPWSSRSFSCRTTLQTLSSSSSTYSALCGWLPRPVVHPPPT